MSGIRAGIRPSKSSKSPRQSGKWGWTMPILAADDGMVLAGHGRLAAGKLLGMTDVPVIVARGWTDQQKRAYVIADNRLTDASYWDDEMLRLELSDLVEGGFEIALTGITEDELSKLRSASAS
jgi:ParB-like chromosome segregation protein Spo0J